MVGQGINVPTVLSVLWKIERMLWGRPLLLFQHPQRAVLEGLVAGCCMIPNSTTARISRVMWELAGQGQPLWLHFQTKHSAKAHSPLSHSGGHTCGWASPAPSPPQHTTGFHPSSRRSPQDPTACLVWSCCVCFLFPLTFKYKYASWGKRS